MRQEVIITLQLILDCDAKLSKYEIEERVNSFIYLGKDVNIIQLDTIEIKEESEIYGNEKS